MSEPNADIASAIAETKQRALDKAAPAALRIAEYFVRCRPNLLNDLCNEDKIDFEDFKTVSAHFGISTYEYEG